LNVPLQHDEIARLLPHKGAMCLLDNALDCNAESIRCLADAARPGHPLRDAAGVSVVHGVEYGAQAAALHQMITRPELRGATGGMLLQMRNVEFSADYLDRLPQPLTITARCAMASSELARYFFAIHSANVLASQGELTLKLS
jgi:predicted hotdog family 3-hydroxylacyl-ACP dehydratase